MARGPQNPRRRRLPPGRAFPGRLVGGDLLDRQLGVRLGDPRRRRDDLRSRHFRSVVRARLSPGLSGQRLSRRSPAATALGRPGFGHADRRHHPPVGRPAKRSPGHGDDDHPRLHDALRRVADDGGGQGVFRHAGVGPAGLLLGRHHRRNRHHPGHPDGRFPGRRLDRPLPGPAGRGRRRHPAAVCRHASGRFRRPLRGARLDRPLLSVGDGRPDGAGPMGLRRWGTGHRPRLSRHAPRRHPLHGRPRRPRGPAAADHRHAVGRRRLLRRRSGRSGRPRHAAEPGGRREGPDRSRPRTGPPGHRRTPAGGGHLGRPLDRIVTAAGRRLGGVLRHRRGGDAQGAG